MPATMVQLKVFKLQQLKCPAFTAPHNCHTNSNWTKLNLTWKKVKITKTTFGQLLRRWLIDLVNSTKFWYEEKRWQKYSSVFRHSWSGMLQTVETIIHERHFWFVCACIPRYLKGWCRAVTDPAAARPQGSPEADVSTPPAWCSALRPETGGPCFLPGSSPGWWWTSVCLDTNQTWSKPVFRGVIDIMNPAGKWRGEVKTNSGLYRYLLFDFPYR